MAEQNFKNHIRLVPVHIIGYLIAGSILGMSIVKFYRSYSTGFGGMLVPTILVLNALVLLIVLWYSRIFALRAHDKAIRAEENLRYFAITGKLLDSKLRMGQIVALRFAPNNELVDLAHRAIVEDLSGKQIKAAIQHWKPDYNRV
ncbi:MAG: hypothetical protein EOO13_17800 [Chitinophagaceae bacterium]|nr:MAG: hypothetical protein EOO13_17800 [Chitinophagaceae bacterium]